MSIRLGHYWARYGSDGKPRIDPNHGWLHASDPDSYQLGDDEKKFGQVWSSLAFLLRLILSELLPHISVLEERVMSCGYKFPTTEYLAVGWRRSALQEEKEED
ncbi:hypothetical protein QBC36DRAFT_308449 [Triangularia setosa]|uniref:Uncharacterized protein n=1 Tax=Triangularia setosa TaxID=2587417 RepID=A0AAN6WC38_9PEZI|nr:hypothetical protein QBC36DRAFT_308449 [Podospora setosa]